MAKDKDKKPDSSNATEVSNRSAGDAGGQKAEPTTSAQPNKPRSGKGRVSKVDPKALKKKLKNFKQPGAAEAAKKDTPKSIAELSQSLGISRVKLAAVMAHYGWTLETKLHKLDFAEKVNAWSNATA